jgi:hypothetical protein
LDLEASGVMNREIDTGSNRQSVIPYVHCG